MGTQLKTIVVAHPTASHIPLTINHRDYDPSKHTLFEESSDNEVVKPIEPVEQQPRRDQDRLEDIKAELNQVYTAQGWAALRNYIESLIPDYERPDGLSWQESIPDAAQTILSAQG